MTVLVASRHDVNLGTLRRVALERESVRVADSALALMNDTHERFQRYVTAHSGSFIYGVTSGYGPAASTRWAPAETRDATRRRVPWLGLSFGGPHLPEYVSRGAVFAGLAALVSGHTAAHPGLARAVCERLDGPLPRLPSRGLVAAGDILPRFILGAATGPAAASEGFSAGPGNGSQTSNAMAGLAAIFARRRLEVAERVFALSAEAIAAPPGAYHPGLAQLWSDPYASAALDALRAALDGGSEARRPREAPLSYRILPQVLGQARRALARLEDVATSGLSAVVTNPSFVFPEIGAVFPEIGAVFPQASPVFPEAAAPGADTASPEDGAGEVAISTGGFHNAAAAPAIDSLAASWANLGVLAHRHAVKLHKGSVSLLPDRLLPEGTDYTTGFSTTYLEYVPNQAIEEMRRLAQSTLLTPAEIAASEQDDIAITAPVAYLAEREVAARFDEVLTVLAVTCSQAFHLTGRPVPPRLAGLLGFVGSFVPPVQSRRPLGAECGRLAAALSEAIESGWTGQVLGD